ncbi:MAG: transporter substrate-binding domain-containing protein [Bacteroidales bacterium]
MEAPRRSAWLCLALLLVLFRPAISQDTLKIGYFEGPPHVYMENGEVVGAAVDYFELIADKMGLEHWQFEYTPINRLFDYLESGKMDVGLNFGKTDERSARFAYPAEPFSTTAHALAVRIDFPLSEIRSVEDLIPLRLGYLKGANHPGMLGDPRLQYHYIYGREASRQNVLRVRAGRIDAAVASQDELVYHIWKLHLQNELKILALPGTSFGLYTIMSPPCATLHLKDYEKALQELQEEITYPEVLDSYMRGMNHPALSTDRQ